jgi:hypothetical protein
MAFENTITESDIDPNSRRFVQELCRDLGDAEPDLSVDGMTDSILSRILGLFGGRSR